MSVEAAQKAAADLRQQNMDSEVRLAEQATALQMAQGQLQESTARQQQAEAEQEASAAQLEALQAQSRFASSAEHAGLLQQIAAQQEELHNLQPYLATALQDGAAAQQRALQVPSHPWAQALHFSPPLLL